MNSCPRFGIVLGRFQPLHLGHMEYLEAARDRCERLVVGVTNPNISNLIFSHADPKRSEAANNPFSYFVRHEMVDRALRCDGWSPDRFAIVPADVTDLARVAAFLPPVTESTVFVTVYDAWGEEKARRLETLGFAVEVLWRRSMADRFTTGAAVRERMRLGGSWQQLVPIGVRDYFEEQGGRRLMLDGSPDDDGAKRND